MLNKCNRRPPRKLEVWEWVVKRRIFDPFSELSGWVWFLPELSMNLHIWYTVLQGGLVLGYPFSPVAVLRFVAIFPLIIPGRRYLLPG